MDRGEKSAAWLVPNQIEEELHVGVPVLLTTRYAALCFRMFSSASENGFVQTLAGTKRWQFRDQSACFLWHQRSDSTMLEAIVLLLGVSTCALILIAFWGLDLLGMRRRRG
jgi:hypothetical protein